jgi:hypothetical protein
VGTRFPNPKLVKIHRSYTVEEAATICGVHRNTLRLWIRQGLPCIDQDRPTLIQGQQLVDFIRRRRTGGKRPCEPGQIYCMRCREPRRPLDDFATYQPMTPTLGNLVGVCPTCASRMFRRVSLAKLALSSGSLHVLMTHAQDHIDETAEPTVNSDFKPEAMNHD